MTIAEARQTVGRELGLGAFETPADLTPNDRERLYDALADYIIANWDEFDKRAREWASRRIDSPLFKTPLEDYSAKDALSSFAGEFARQGKQIVSFENPFVRYAVIFGAVGFGLYLAVKADRAARVVKS